MQKDSKVAGAWLRLLGQALRSWQLEAAEVEGGYHLAVRAPKLSTESDKESPSGDFLALKSRIPNLTQTRAVYLDSGSAYNLLETAPLRAWAGDLANDVETGARRAFAVVDIEAFGRRVTAELSAAGWSVEQTDEDLEVSDGRFTERVNLLRAVVRMVLSRSNMAEAARWTRGDIDAAFARDLFFFLRFHTRFGEFRPGTIDHFFVLYPDDSCVALAWDYWQLSGRTAEEAEQLFQQGMEDFHEFLQVSADDWLPGAPLAASAQDLTTN